MHRIGLNKLATRSHISCTKFVNRLKSEKEEYNQLACIAPNDLEPAPIGSNLLSTECVLEILEMATNILSSHLKETPKRYIKVYYRIFILPFFVTYFD